METKTNVAVIVAHSVDETRWVGGTILAHPRWQWFIVTLNQENNNEYSQKLEKVLKLLKASGNQGDIVNVGNPQKIDKYTIQNTIMALLPDKKYDLILTYDPKSNSVNTNEYNEIGRNVIDLWHTGVLLTKHIWTFAYEEDGRKPSPQADFTFKLPKEIWLKKHQIISEIYGINKSSSFRHKIPRKEAFRCFKDPIEALVYMQGNN